jgi:acetolactate synthase-1/2/3 large subunit
LGNPDIADFARSLGAEAYIVNSPQDLENVLPTVLNRANNDGVPQVIVANIDRTAIPPYYNAEYIVTASSQNN